MGKGIRRGIQYQVVRRRIGQHRSQSLCGVWKGQAPIPPSSGFRMPWSSSMRCRFCGSSTASQKFDPRDVGRNRRSRFDDVLFFSEPLVLAKPLVEASVQSSRSPWEPGSAAKAGAGKDDGRALSAHVRPKIRLTELRVGHRQARSSTSSRYPFDLLLGHIQAIPQDGADPHLHRSPQMLAQREAGSLRVSTNGVSVQSRRPLRDCDSVA